MEEKLYPTEGQKEGINYQHRSQFCDLSSFCQLCRQKDHRTAADME